MRNPSSQSLPQNTSLLDFAVADCPGIGNSGIGNFRDQAIMLLRTLTAEGQEGLCHSPEVRYIQRHE